MKDLLKFLSPLGLAVALALPSTGPIPAAEWTVAAPAAVGFAPDLGERLDAALDSEAYSGVHAVVLIRGGKLVYERYLAGDDEIWGRSKSGVVFTPDSLHDVRSVTKSVVGLLYGIALDEGIVPSVDAPVVTAFPQYADLGDDAARRQILIRHMLSMTMGLEWDEMTVPYGEPENSENAMNEAQDSLRYALDRPVASLPGTSWTYSGGAAELAGEIIAQGAGTGLIDYARDRLFNPLGMGKFEWVTDYYGRPHSASSLRLRPRDTAKIGQLVLDGGLWNGERIVSADWIGASIEPYGDTGEGCRYGYFWWLCETGGGLKVIEGSGWGGQQLLILRDLDIVLVSNAGLYGDPDAWRRAYGLLEEVVLPALDSH